MYKDFANVFITILLMNNTQKIPLILFPSMLSLLDSHSFQNPLNLKELMAN